MIRSLLCILLSLYLLFASCESQKNIKIENHFTGAQLFEDYDYLVNKIQSNHPRFFTDLSEFRQAADECRDNIKDSMTVLEFYRLIAPVTAKVRCGHTRLSLPESVNEQLYKSGNYLPFKIGVVGDSLFIREIYFDQSEIESGDRIISIDSKPLAEIVKQLKSGIYADGFNETYKTWLINQDFAGWYLELIENPAQFEIEFRKPDGSEYTQTVMPMTRQAIIKYKTENGMVKKSKPLIDMRFVPDSAYALLSIAFFEYYDDIDEFSVPIDSFFNEIASNHIPNLILDLRENDGGEAHESAYLLHYLIDEPFQYFADKSTFLLSELKSKVNPAREAFRGNIYVLIDGGCYSTTGHFCSLLKYHTSAVFIGEETGGSYACNSGFKELNLPNTGITLLLPLATFITDVEGFERGRGIRPDYKINQTVDDVINEKDRALDKALSLIEK